MKFTFTLLILGKSEFGGEGGIRTLDTLLEYARFPGVCLKPLGHLSGRKRKLWPLTRRESIFFGSDQALNA